MFPLNFQTNPLNQPKHRDVTIKNRDVSPIFTGYSPHFLWIAIHFYCQDMMGFFCGPLDELWGKFHNERADAWVWGGNLKTQLTGQLLVGFYLVLWLQKMLQPWFNGSESIGFANVLRIHWRTNVVFFGNCQQDHHFKVPKDLLWFDVFNRSTFGEILCTLIYVH